MPKRPFLTLLAGLAGLALLAGCSGQSAASTGGSAGSGSASSSSGGAIPVQQVDAAYPVTVDQAAATILAGQPSAAKTVDAYEDFLCPYCGQYERGNAETLDKALAAGQIKVRYHILNLLDSHSEPAGYSALAANAALLVAQEAPRGFMTFHTSLYAHQPEEGGAGYTAEQLTALAKAAGVTDTATFAVKLGGQPYTKQITANLKAAETDPKLQQSFQGQSAFGTPTVLVNGKMADLSKQDWLTTT